MFNCWYIIFIGLSIYHETDAEKLTRQCTASQGRCAKTKNSNCESSFGSGWTAKGICCRRKPCCVFQCEIIQSETIPNGTVTVKERNVGSTAYFSCNEGYLLDGNQSITCSLQGWNGDVPQCRRLYILCPETEVYFRGSKYLFNCGINTWQDSQAFCLAKGGQLTSIETHEENTFLLDVIKLLKKIHNIQEVYWIGLTDNNSEKSYKWLSGEPLNYNDWFQGPQKQPDNLDFLGETDLIGAHCALIDEIYNLHWSDEFCQNNFHFICEIRHESTFNKFPNEDIINKFGIS